MFELFKDLNGEFRFRLTSDAGEPLLRSYAYETKEGVLNGVNAVRVASQKALFETKLTKAHQHFLLFAGNGQVIGFSDYYLTAKGVLSGIDCVKMLAPIAKIKDLT